MIEKLSVGIIVASLLIGMLALSFNILVVEGEQKTIYVDDDNIDPPWYGTVDHPYRNITSGIENADVGDVVFVYGGKYCERIVVNKTVSLIGENPLTTIVDGEGSSLLILSIVAPEVICENFTVQNTTFGQEAYGISVLNSKDVTLRNSIVRRCWFGILLTNSTNCSILQNNVVDNYREGIYLRDESSDNSVVGNSISGSPTGIYVTGSSQNNILYRNNIVDNEIQAFIGLGSHTFWDNGAEGNYWSDYEGLDLDGDGIGDTGLPHIVDYYPLIELWNKTRTYVIGFHNIVVNCNCTVASFMFNQSQKQVSFYITGPEGWNGFCDVTIPKELLAPNQTALEKWVIMFGSSPLTDAAIFENNFTRISFNYTLGTSMSESRVRLKVGRLYPPTADFSYFPSIASTVQPVNFTDMSEKSPNGTIDWRRWDFGDGNVTVWNQKWLLHRYNETELFNVTLTVKDDNDLTDSVTKSVLVNNVSPVASFMYTPVEPSVGEMVTFNASDSYDLDGIIEEYLWDFGDGTTVSENKPTTTHAFEHVKLLNSRYKVTLTVRDSEDAVDSTTELVLVRKGLASVEVNAPIITKPEEPFTVNVSLRNWLNQPLAEEQVCIYENDVSVANVSTDNNGMANTTLELDTVGEHLIKAVYEGSLDYLASSNTTIVIVNPLNTTLTVNAPENATQNEVFTVFASLISENEESVSDATVEFYWYNGSSWRLIGSSLTNQSGVASLNCTLQQVGVFPLKAEFNGFGIYAASSSAEHSLTVTASETEYLPYVIVVIIIFVIILVSFMVLRRKKHT